MTRHRLEGFRGYAPLHRDEGAGRPSLRVDCDECRGSGRIAEPPRAIPPARGVGDFAVIEMDYGSTRHCYACDGTGERRKA